MRKKSTKPSDSLWSTRSFSLPESERDHTVYAVKFPTWECKTGSWHDGQFSTFILLLLNGTPQLYRPCRDVEGQYRTYIACVGDWAGESHKTGCISGSFFFSLVLLPFHRFVSPYSLVRIPAAEAANSDGSKEFILHVSQAQDKYFRIRK